MTYFLENKDDRILAPNGSEVDDLDFAVLFDTREEAEKTRSEMAIPNYWVVMEDISE